MDAKSPTSHRDAAGRWLVAVVIGLGLGRVALDVTWVRAQSRAPAARPSFEVASVKPNMSAPAGMVRIMMPTGRFSATNVTLRMLLRNAYALQDVRMSGGPAWLDTDRFDVEARAEGAASPGDTAAMLRSLLEERFKLQAHFETRDLPIYALVTNRSDGRLGDQLRRSGEECLPISAPAGAPPAPPAPPGPPPARGTGQCPSMLGFGHVSGRHLTLERLAQTISPWVDRVVVDKANLAGPFDVDLQWSPELPNLPPGARAPGEPAIVNGRVVDPNGPSIFTALREQLGLKLDAQRGPVEVLVIDRAERPADD